MNSTTLTHAEALDDIFRSVDPLTLEPTETIISSGKPTILKCTRGTFEIGSRLRQETGRPDDEIILHARYVPNEGGRSPIHIYTYLSDGKSRVYFENGTPRQGFEEGPPGYQCRVLETKDIREVVKELRKL